MTETGEKRQRGFLRKEKGNMALKSVESQNVEFKSSWPKARLEKRDEAGENYELKSRPRYW